VVGWTDPEGARPFLGALLLGQTAFKKHSAFNVSAAIRLRPSPARIRLAGSGGRERRELAHESASFSEHDFAGHAPISIRAPSAPINNLRLHID